MHVIEVKQKNFLSVVNKHVDISTIPNKFATSLYNLLIQL